MRLAEQLVPRSYHLWDYDWTPLSQNPCWKATISTSPDATRIAIGFGPASYVIVISFIGRDKSSVDDFDMERGSVRMRVGFVLRSAELQPLFRWFVIKSLLKVVVFVLSWSASHRLRPPFNPIIYNSPSWNAETSSIHALVRKTRAFTIPAWMTLPGVLLTIIILILTNQGT